MREGFWRWGERDREPGMLVMGGRKCLAPVAIFFGILAGWARPDTPAEAGDDSDVPTLTERMANLEVGAAGKGDDAFPANSKGTDGNTGVPVRTRVQRKVKEPGRAVSRRVPPKTKDTAPALLPETLGRVRDPALESSGREAASTRQKPVEPETPPRASEDFAPYGRIIKCELVFTVDSINLNTPIVGLVMEDIWWNGRLIVPAGSEVFSKAIPNRVLNRIGDDGLWTFVLPAQPGKTNGREMVVRGCALDRAEAVTNQRGEARSWGVGDGSAGLQGYLIDEADREKVELFIATALAGAVEGLASGLQTRVIGAGNAGLRGGSLLPSTLENAGLTAAGKGASDLLNLYARQIMAEVQKNGAYVRVPAGKTFYVFVDQTMDSKRAEVGLRLP